ncbi:MAG: beta-phosphoglucomutase [Planctomycetes bacterium]|nr:beta-phosphoglucomutase [Planctomycetota bacterium]
MMKACLFDLDGVLVDTAIYHFRAWGELAQKYNFEFTEEHNEKLKGVSRMDSLEILMKLGSFGLNHEQKLKEASWKNEIYCSYIETLTPNDILPGVKEFLDALKVSGIGIALGSASKNAPSILERLEITSYFDAIIDGNQVSNAKPDPEVFLKGAEQLGVAPSDCIVFEDAEAGVEAAIRGGMKCVGVGSPEVLARADMVISNFNELSLDILITKMDREVA